MGAIYILPIRLFMSFCILATYHIFLIIIFRLYNIYKLEHYIEPYPKILRKIIDFTDPIFNYLLILSFGGIFKINHIKLKIQDYDKDYPNQTESDYQEKYPIIVCNH